MEKDYSLITLVVGSIVYFYVGLFILNNYIKISLIKEFTKLNLFDLLLFSLGIAFLILSIQFVIKTVKYLIK